MEKDEIRRHDSFQAFEEICSIAEQQQVDLILLGGDLFHENKPSRSTLVKAIEILRRHCLHDKPLQFQVVSDQTVNFANSDKQNLSAEEVLMEVNEALAEEDGHVKKMKLAAV